MPVPSIRETPSDAGTTGVRHHHLCADHLAMLRPTDLPCQSAGALDLLKFLKCSPTWRRTGNSERSTWNCPASFILFRAVSNDQNPAPHWKVVLTRLSQATRFAFEWKMQPGPRCARLKCGDCGIPTVRFEARRRAPILRSREKAA